MSDYNDNYEKKLITKLASSAINEQRARRRWGIFFKFLIIIYIAFLTFISYGSKSFGTPGYDDKGYAAVINIHGAISADGYNSSQNVNHLLRQAFKNDEAKGIILNINSPGGSAVESNRIYKEIMRLREKHPEKKIYTVVGDLCASGGYFIAAATHKIFVDEGSLIGSIGVILSSFGFVGTMEKLGIERRVIAAGENKNILDPFSEQNPSDRFIIKAVVDDVHQVFIDAVKEGREGRLSTTNPEIFEGTIYSGSDSIKLGLADDINDIGGVARDLIGVDNIVFYDEDNLLKKLSEKLSTTKIFSSEIFTPRIQ